MDAAADSAGLATVQGARAWFGAQAVAGAVWWASVLASDRVRVWTLGGWEPRLLVGPDLVLFAGASAVAAVRGNRVAAAVAATWTTAVTVGLAAYGLVERSAGWGVAAMVVATAGTLAATAVLWLGRLPTEWFFVGPFSFRVAEPGPGRRHLRRSLVQLVVFWTTFFVLVPWVLAAAEQRLRLGWPVLRDARWDVVAAAVFVAASALGLWSCVTMALLGEGTPLPAQTARELVVAGPYRWVRNPMAAAGALQTAAVGLWHGSWTVVALAAIGAVAWNQLIRPGEEADLAARFGAPYQRYAAEVRCWLPTRPSPRRAETSRS